MDRRVLLCKRQAAAELVHTIQYRLFPWDGIRAGLSSSPMPLEERWATRRISGVFFAVIVPDDKQGDFFLLPLFGTRNGGKRFFFFYGFCQG